ncbi:WXG100-like domain-containing protein [Microbispora bryophytorum]|uniref:Outer membrane channel protein CpnT-like N-terminal domain-containing protein n=1 Tax=Microbispora bryophytorum TaxID=1460882 RepID=A0A8H9GVP9_9ACTN|nr:hypothetical protein [Microbispora bryophytorum]MBD3136108.1 hypothetical protein [Microbispora bryophytorum]TQS07857.1 hypothetical protein FLX07_08580 [Microbispora bryophytorum]GGO04498.1 hypothetical protein GCM10011574_15480 [Microbispora bryophytorum]
MTHSSTTGTGSGAKPATTNGDVTSTGDGLPGFADGGGSVADVTPAWGESLPAWADDLIAMLTAGQTWPEASESLLWQLARAHRSATVSVVQSIDPVGAAAVAVLSGMQGPSMQAFLARLGEHYSEQSGLLGVANNHFAYAAQADDYARATQYSKLSNNVMFWIALIATFIALVAAFYSAGASTRLVGPIAARARAEMERILEQLALAAGRPAAARALARGTALASVRAGLLGRILANPLGREIVEEIGEEIAGDGIAQFQQGKMGTRDGWEWKMTSAAALGAAGGAAVGMGAARPVSNLVNRTPLLRRLNTDAPGFGNAFKRFPGRALTTGLTNVIASPAGSVLANGLVYGQWEMPDGESLLGAALSGAARTNTISPFNLDAIEAGISPRTALASAYDTSLRTDLTRALSGTSPASAAGQPSGGDPGAASTNTAGGGQITGTGGSTGSGSTSPASVAGQPSGGQPATSGAGQTAAATPSGSTQAASTAPSPAASGQATAASSATSAPSATAGQPAATGVGQAGAATPSGSTQAASTAPSPAPSGAGPTNPGIGSAANAGGAAPGTAGSGTPAPATPATSTASPTPAASPTSAPASTGTPSVAPSAASLPGGATSPATSSAAASPAAAAAPGPGAQAPAASASASSGTTAGTTSGSAALQASARTAVSDVLFTIAPDVLFLRDGQGARLTGPDGRSIQLPGEDMKALADRLTARAAEGVDTPRLRAEAAALLGARIAEESQGLPVEGALDALARLADATPDSRAAAVAVAGEVLEDNPRGWRPDRLSDAGAGLVEEAVVPPHGLDHALRVGRSSDIAADIVRRAESLAGIASASGTNGTPNPASGGQAVAASAGASSNAAASPNTANSNTANSNTGAAPAANSAQTANPARPGTRPGPRTTRGRGNVTARPIVRSLFVADGRPPHLADLSQQEAERGFLSLRASDVAPDVTALRTAGEQTVVVDTGRLGAQHFRFEVGPVRGGRLARTGVRSGTAADPHVVRLSPRLANDILPRVWLHEISDVFQRMSGPRQGVIRSFLSRTAEPDATACVTARYREHALLDRQWRAAPAQERPAIVHEIEQLGREIERLGHAAPASPWSAPRPSAAPQPAPDPATQTSTAQTSTAQSPAPQSPAAPDPVADLLGLARAQQDTLTKAADELLKAVKGKIDSTKAATADAKKAEEAAEKASQEQDRGAGERRRKALADRDAHRASAERAGQSKEAYARAVRQAVEARRAYQTLESALNAVPAGRTGTPPAEIARLAREAEAAHTAYKEAFAEALPAPEVLSEATPAGRLPHLERLTQVVNDMLERAGVDHRYAPDELSHVLRSNFRWVVSQDGVLLRVGRGTRAELRLRLRVTDLVEVFGHPVRHSQSMLGQLPQGGRSASATANRAVRLAPNLDLNALTKPWQDTHWLGMLMKFGVFRIGSTFGRSESFNGNASDFALAGAVQDNAGEALVLDGLASAEVELRTATGAETARVDGGTAGDAGSLRMYLPHTHAQRGPAEVTRIHPKERQRTPFPEHAVTGLTGLQDLAERTAARIGHSEVGGMTRDQIFTIMTKELPARLGEAINDPEGLRRPITVNGRVIGYVQIHTEVMMDTARPVGTPSTKHRLERLRVGFSGASGSRSAGRSFEIRGTAGAQLPVGNRHMLRAAGLDGYKTATPRLTGGLGRSWSRSRSMSAGGTAIRPSVQRWAGHTQAYALELEHTVTVRLNTDDAPHTPVEGQSRGLFRMPEPQAYRYGLPVDRSAVQKDGRLRDDPTPGTPEGRLPRLPGWSRRAAGGATGAGPALVQASERPQSVRNLDEVRTKVEVALRARGLLPGENGRLSRDPLTRASQIANMIELAEQFSPARLQTAYDQAMQDGILLDLVTQGIGRASRHLTVRIRLAQSGQEEFQGTSAADVVTDLDISSETSGRSVGRSRGRSRDVGPGLGLETKPGQGGSTGGGFGAHWSKGHTFSTTLNDTGNLVTLAEGTAPAAVFEVPHRLTVDLIEDDGTATLLARSGDVWMRVLLPSDLLPEQRAEPSPSHPTSPEALSLATLLHVDGTGVLGSLRSVLPKAMRPGSVSFHHLAEAFTMRNLISHPEWLLADPAEPATTYSTALAVRPRGLRTHRASAWVTARLGESTFVTAADLVVGDINFTMGAHTTRTETRGGRSVDASTGVSEALPGPLGGKEEAGASGAGSRSSAISDTAIWGRERLAIDTGKHYVFEMKADITVSGDETGNRRADAAPLRDRTVVYSLPERDALDFYGTGRLKLPLDQVADAVTRLLDGNLRLDPRTAVPLVRRYLADRALARRNGHPRPDLEHKHPRDVLTERLAKDFPMRVAAEGNRLKQMHDRLPDLASRVDVPDLYRDSLGESTVKRAELTAPDGTPTRLIDQVLDQIGKVAPGALKRDPVLLRSLFGDFAGKRWWGKIDDMSGTEGFVKTYSLRIGPHLTEDVTVRISAVLHGDEATYGGNVHNFGQILQDYTYTQEDHAESSGKTFGGNANAGAGQDAGSGGRAVATDRSHTGTATTGTQRTRIQRHAAFRGGQLVEHPLTVTIEVERTSSRLRGAVAKATRVPRAGRVTLDGTMTRVLPDGMVAKEGTVAARPPARPDVRRVVPPEVFATEGLRADGLLRAVFDRLSRKDLLGGAATMEHYAELAKALTGNGLTTRLERMTGPDGHRLIRLPMPGRPGRVVDVRIHAGLSEPDPVALGLNDTELGLVDREQNTAGTATDRGQMLPLGRTYSGGHAAGVGADLGAGDQTAQSSSGSGGNRDETSVFAKSTGAKVRFRVDFDLRFEVRQVARGGAETVLRTEDIPHGATGTAHLIMFQYALEEMLARRDAGATRPLWDFHRQRAATPGVFLSHDTVRALAARQPSYDPAAPSRAMAAALRGRTGTLPVGIVADIGQMNAAPTNATPANPTQTNATPATPPGSMALVEEARLLARDLGADVHLHLRRPDGSVERYLATPAGELSGESFAEALGTVPPDLVALAEGHGLDLRDLYGGRSDGFADRIGERLDALGVARPAPADPGWPVPETAADATWGGTTLITAPPGSVTAEPIPKTAFVADGRAPHLPGLSNAEIPAAVADLRPADFGRGVHAVTATPDGTVVTVETARFGTQRFTVLPEDPGGGRPGRTEVAAGAGPHVIRLAPRLAPDVVARVLLHEISDTLQKRSAAEQGTVRRFLNALDPGYDACASARYNEHAYLSRRWRATTSDEERARLRHEIEAVARDLGARGQVAPPPPWVTVPPQAPVPDLWERMRRLSNTSGWEPPDEDDTVPAPEDTGQRNARNV